MKATYLLIFLTGGSATVNLPQPDVFDKALYTLDIGQNDISEAFSSNLTETQINTLVIPQIISELTSQLKVITTGKGFLPPLPSSPLES
jgi:hypothetical protein